jgi:hypothetical protein
MKKKKKEREKIMNLKGQKRIKDPTIKPWHKIWVSNYAVTPPFKKCLIPECHYTYICLETLESHMKLEHPEAF